MTKDNPLLVYFERLYGALIPVRIIRIDGGQVTIVVTGTKSAQGHAIAPYERGEYFTTTALWLKSRDVRWRTGKAYTIPADINAARAVLPADHVSRDNPQE
jgi:hypothetical protein